MEISKPFNSGVLLSTRTEVEVLYALKVVSCFKFPLKRETIQSWGASSTSVKFFTLQKIIPQGLAENNPFPRIEEKAHELSV